MQRMTICAIIFIYSVLLSLTASAVDESIPCGQEPTDESINYGDTINCSIETGGDSDLFRLQGQAGEIVRLHIADDNNFGSAIVEVFDPIGDSIASTSSEITIALSLTGTYVLNVSEVGGDATLNYNIAIERVAPTPSPGATHICYACTESNSTNPGGDMDLYWFDGVASDVITIQVSDDNSFGSAVVAIFDTTGMLLGYGAPTVQLELAVTGKHSIVVYENGRNATLNYDLTLQCLVGDCSPPPSSLVISPASGSFASSQTFDFAFILEGRPDLSVVGGSATFDGNDVSANLGSCLISGTLLGGGGGQTFRCPGLDGSALAPGLHTFVVTLDLSDGSSVSDSVIWNFKENSEP